MPAVSEKQRKLMAIAEHAPEKLYAKNKGVAKMTHEQLHDFAATKEKGLPSKVKKSKPASSDSESHQYNWRNQRGRRAPMMMKGK